MFMENPALAPLLLEVLLPILLPGKFLMHLPVRVETAQLLPLLVITMKRGSYYPLILDLFLFPVIYTDLYRNFLFFSKKIWVKSFLWISPRFCWYPIWHYSNGALIIYPITTFFCSIKSSKKSYYTILILSFIHSSTLSLLIFTASAILSTWNPISARESAVFSGFL